MREGCTDVRGVIKKGAHSESRTHDRRFIKLFAIKTNSHFTFTPVLLYLLFNIHFECIMPVSNVMF